MKKLIKKFGINELVIKSVTAKLIQAVGSVLLLLIIALKFNNYEQGFYFTFLSLAALQIFFELGLGTLITQKIAKIVHNGNNNSINDIFKNNEEKLLNEIKEIYFYNLIWSLAAAILLVPVVYGIGYLIIQNSEKTDIVSWKIQWMTLCVLLGIQLIANLQISFFEGAGYLSEILKLKTKISFITPVVTITALLLNGGLFAISLIYLTQSLLIINWIKKTIKYEIKWKLINFFNIKVFIKWFGIIWPMQWKISVSWICGYIIYQSITPILMKYEGAIASGEYGLIANINNQMITLISAWAATKIPYYAKLRNDDNIKKLDIECKKTNKQIMAVWLIISIILGLFFLEYYHYKKQFYVSIYTLMMLLLISLFTLLTYSKNVLIRTFQIEPSLGPSVSFVIITIITYMTIGNEYGANGVAGSLLAGSLASVCFTNLKYRKIIKESMGKKNDNS